MAQIKSPALGADSVFLEPQLSGEYCDSNGKCTWIHTKKRVSYVCILFIWAVHLFSLSALPCCPTLLLLVLIENDSGLCSVSRRWTSTPVRSLWCSSSTPSCRRSSLGWAYWREVSERFVDRESSRRRGWTTFWMLTISSYICIFVFDRLPNPHSQLEPGLS